MALNGTFLPKTMSAEFGETKSSEARPLLSPPYSTRPGEPVFLLEGSTLEDLWAVRRNVNSLVKSKRNPLVVMDRAWEGFGPMLFGSVLYDHEDRLFKMWYIVFHDFAFKHHLPGSYMACYATSKDGYAWHKPDLGLVEWKGSKRNNFVQLGRAIVSGIAVVKTPPGIGISKRYVAAYLDGPGVCISYSDDGINWVEDKCNPIEGSESDTQNSIVYDPAAQKWLVHLRPPVYAGPWKRRIALMESRDLQSWTRPETVLIPDEADPPEFYAMPVFRRGNLFFGFLRLYNDEAGTQVVELVFSPDGRHWDRVPPREHFLDRGSPGEFDYGMVSSANTPVIVDGEMRIYYGASRTFHNQQEGPGSYAIGLASISLDRFFGVTTTSSEQPGFILTRPLLSNGSSLFVNSKTLSDRGLIKVAVLDVAGEEIPGFGFDDCVPVKDDGFDNIVIWKGGKRLAELPRRPLRLKFQLEMATFYAFYMK